MTAIRNNTQVPYPSQYRPGSSNGLEALKSGLAQNRSSSGLDAALRQSGCSHSEIGDSWTGHQTQFSPQAQMIMTMMSLMTQMMSGVLGSLMNSAGQDIGQAHSGFSPQVHPGFGADTTQRATKKTGAVKDLQPGESTKGSNGTSVSRGKDGLVSIGFKDQCGCAKSLTVKDGQLSLDGGKTFQKLDNLGQILKLPNGDVVAIGNAEQANGQKNLSRVTVSDSVDAIQVDEPGKTNIYDVSEMNQAHNGHQGGGFSVDLKANQSQTAFGSQSHLNATFSAFSGNSSIRSAAALLLKLTGVK